MKSFLEFTKEVDENHNLLYTENSELRDIDMKIEKSKKGGKSYELTTGNFKALIAYTELPYTNQKGFKSYHKGWGFVVDGDSHSKLEPAFGSKDKAVEAAIRYAKLMKLI